MASFIIAASLVNAAAVIAENLKCSVCKDWFDEPVTVACGHTFCEVCLAKWRKSAGITPELEPREIRIRKLKCECPTCRGNITYQSFDHPNREMKDQLAILETECPHCEEKWIIDQLRPHKEVCPDRICLTCGLRSEDYPHIMDMENCIPSLIQRIGHAKKLIEMQDNIIAKQKRFISELRLRVSALEDSIAQPPPPMEEDINAAEASTSGQTSMEADNGEDSNDSDNYCEIIHNPLLSELYTFFILFFNYFVF